MANDLMKAADMGVAAGQLTASQRDEVAKVAAIDWRIILQLLPTLAAFFPPLLPFVPIISWIVNLIFGGGNVPVPVPPPSPFPPIPGPIPNPN